MTPRARMQRGFVLRLYLAVSHLIPLVATQILKRRLARGKEDPDRWREKQAHALAPRPDGPLIWINAVGLGEVLSLRGLIARMAERDPRAQFLVTSTTTVSARVFSQNLPPRTLHQFLPLDAPRYRRRFLNHFRPDLCVWAEQDIWPGFVSDLNSRGIPQAIIAARMDERAYLRHRQVRALYRDLYSAMSLITAQDAGTAAHVRELGTPEQPTVTGSLKPAAPPLQTDEDEVQRFAGLLKDRKIWATAPSHPEDEAIALEAQARLFANDPAHLLLLAPRFPERRAEIAKTFPRKLRSKDKTPTAQDSVWLFDTFGEMGLLYRLSQLALIGGTFSDIEGHNPWEAVILNTPVAHGPRTRNFLQDFKDLDEAGAASTIESAEDLIALLTSPTLPQMARAADTLIAEAGAKVDHLAARLLDMVEVRNG